MSNKIVVGIDGSAISERAVEFAADEAELHGTELEIIYAIALPTDVDFYGVTIAGPQIEALQHYADELLSAAVTTVNQRHPDLVCTTNSVIGTPTWVLINASEDAAAIVVGRRGLGAVKSAFLGSVSSRLATEASCPVFVISEDEQRPTSGPIVVGVDDSEFGTAALAFALTQAAARETTVRAVSAYRTPAIAIPIEPELVVELRKSEAAEAERILNTALEQARTPETASVEVVKVTVEDSPADAILTQSKDAQLIVVGSHGKGFVKRLLLGSVSRQVLHEADRPVAVVDLSH
ncbi:universal stress protein [Microlunatus sp. Gsoil 973]|jgi:nucleotide-binding universal stress UspA family protein|uniref:universal stress protein n=1 Tax=Microlunatus sp. Gsoil 973 TaxID=2672569 RepID=UPI0012B4E215|nr:universal stress protein [Microlunatus sp. Gsoil 973]QGN33975.1 universal stress protein [Microlunatus sp. Gsoil 973]